MIGKPSRAAPKYLSDLFRNGTPAALSDADVARFQRLMTTRLASRLERLDRILAAEHRQAPGFERDPLRQGLRRTLAAWTYWKLWACLDDQLGAPPL